MEITVTKANFDSEILNSDKPVLLDFWAPWCGPCRMLSPVIHEIAEKNSQTLKVGKINVEEAPELAERYGVASIPTVLIMNGGKVVKTAVGYRSRTQLEDMLKSEQ